jgi:peptidoglycan/LPS O-acetylase OafA/YrhL
LILTGLLPAILMVSLFVTTGYAFSVLPPYKEIVSKVMAKKSFSSELESMRGLLAFSVVIHHAVVWYLMLYYGAPDITGPNGNLYSQLGVASVTLFFFMTGFLFWSKLIANPEPDFKNFMGARLRRLGPAYLGAALFMFVLVAFLSHFQLHTSMSVLKRDVLGIFVAETPVLNGLTVAPWLWAVTWTLRFEFLFYLLIPFVGWFAGTLRRSILFLGICGFVYALNHAAGAAHLTPPGFGLYSAFVRHLVFTFSIGITCAHLVRIKKLKDFGRSSWAAVIALVFVLINFYLVPAHYGPVESLSLAFPFFAVACGCNFWGALHSRAVLFLGQISYSVYLIHPLVFGAILIPLFRMEGAHMQSPRIYWPVMFLMAPVLVAVCTLWHHTFELPFLVRATRALVPTDTGVPILEPILGQPVFAAAGGAPLPQRRAHAFALRGEGDPAREGLAFPAGAVPPIRRAGFLPRRSRRAPGRSRIEP